MTAPAKSYRSIRRTIAFQAYSRLQLIALYTLGQPYSGKSAPAVTAAATIFQHEARSPARSAGCVKVHSHLTHAVRRRC